MSSDIASIIKNIQKSAVLELPDDLKSEVVDAFCRSRIKHIATLNDDHAKLTYIRQYIDESLKLTDMFQNFLKYATDQFTPAEKISNEIRKMMNDLRSSSAIVTFYVKLLKDILKDLMIK